MNIPERKDAIHFNIFRGIERSFPIHSPEYSLGYVVFLPISKTQYYHAKEKLFFFVGTKTTVVSGSENIFETKCRIHIAIRKHLFIIAFATYPRKVSCSRYKLTNASLLSANATLDSLEILMPHPHCYSRIIRLLGCVSKLFVNSRSIVFTDRALIGVNYYTVAHERLVQTQH